jgi:hypothetical protein
MLTKTQRFHHSITENGTLQLRIVESVADGETIVAEIYSDPMTPKDPNNMNDWDNVSRSLVEAVSSLSIQDQLIDGKVHPAKITGVGLEESMSYDLVYQEDGCLQVRRIHRIFNDGKEISKKFHRTWVVPGDDSVVLAEPMKSVVKKMHTEAVKDVYKEKRDKDS